MPTRLRIVVAKPGLDGHTRGLQIVARAFMDGGFEVIHLGLYKSAREIVAAAIQEDADAIGLSILSGASPTAVCTEIMDLLSRNGVDDVTLVIGGIIHDGEAKTLKQMGVAEVFLPGTPTGEIVKKVRAEIGIRRRDRNATVADADTDAS